MLGVGGELVEDLVPHRVGGDGAEFVAGDFDGEVEVAALAYLDDRLAGFASIRDSVAGEEAWPTQLDRVLRGGEADALRRCREAGEEGAGRETVFAADERVEAFEGEGEVGAALVVGDGVDLVDDDGADAAEVSRATCRR